MKLNEADASRPKVSLCHEPKAAAREGLVEARGGDLSRSRPAEYDDTFVPVAMRVDALDFLSKFHQDDLAPTPMRPRLAAATSPSLAPSEKIGRELDWRIWSKVARAGVGLRASKNSPGTARNAEFLGDFVIVSSALVDAASACVSKRVGQDQLNRCILVDLVFGPRATIAPASGGGLRARLMLTTAERQGIATDMAARVRNFLKGCLPDVAVSEFFKIGDVQRLLDSCRTNFYFYLIKDLNADYGSVYAQSEGPNAYSGIEKRGLTTISPSDIVGHFDLTDVDFHDSAEKFLMSFVGRPFRRGRFAAFEDFVADKLMARFLDTVERLPVSGNDK